MYIKEEKILIEIVEFVYHDFKIIYKHFESADKLTVEEAEMYFLPKFLYVHKAIY